MDKELNIGDEVLIFKYITEWGLHQDYEHFIKGIIVKSEISDDLSYHGSPWYKMNYTVLGEDGKKYFGNYKHPHLGNSFFMTKEDYIHFLKRKIELNKEKIFEINIENQKYQEIIRSVQIQDDQAIMEIELSSEDETIKYPKFIKIIK